jgi:hypothetical protein
MCRVGTDMRGKRFTVIGAGVALSLSACGLLTKLDAPTGDAPPDASTDAAPDEPATFDACSAPDACVVDAGPPPFYAAEYIDQSFPLATTALKMVEGQVIASYIEFKNVGGTPWTSSTQLGTTAPRNRTSPFADGAWLAPDRASSMTAKAPIKPAGSYKFLFDLQAPQTPGTYFEHFGLVDGNVWFGDPGQGGPPDNDIEVQILVVAPEYRGTFLAQSFPVAPAAVTVTLGAVATGWFQLTNTGTQPWIAGTTKLATIPRDNSSAFVDPKWLSPSRVSTVAANVAPGDVGQFAVQLDATAAGDFTILFGLVEDGVTWFADPTLGGGPADGALSVHLIVVDGTLDAGHD